jgi:cation diffusion facilitator family transporter
VNLFSAWVLQDHHHGHDHEAGHDHGHHDHNIKAAYLHVMADALTSVLAIVALLAGKYFGWAWLDPVIGIVGAGVILIWAYGLLKDTSRILLDRDVAMEELAAVRRALQDDPADTVADLHVWKINPRQKAVMATIDSATPKPPAHYRDRLRAVIDINHVTIEVNHRPGRPETC